MEGQKVQGSCSQLDAAERDPDRDSEPIDPENEGGTRSFKAQDLEEWIVRLRFTQDGERREGNGFYVNMPHPTHHVILTAGHNINDVKLDDLEICSESPTSPSFKASALYVSAAYVANKQEVDDYGVILVKKDPTRPYRGFGFALKRGHDDLTHNGLVVYGLTESANSYKLTASYGTCVDCMPDQLEYALSTGKGFSGSPVIMPYKDNETAVAIHNYGHNSNDAPRGTRINEKVIVEICSWLSIGFFNKAIQASITNNIPLDQRLYLVFIPDSDHAVVRLGYDKEHVTRFDILPAYAPSSNSDFPNDFRHVFRLKRPLEERPLEERWVLWNADRHMVSLTSNLRTFCAATLLEHKAPKPGPTQKKADSKFYYIHLEMTNHHGESTELRELRLSAADLTARDLSMKTFETPEVSFARHKRGKYLFGKIPSKPGAPSKPASEREELHFNLFRLFSG
ncbi:hypothetical protein M419DRAFT_72016 [Trichoderma reesei RUT C-30]|uniref:Serine protease n=1 Tax=Hypocrea jecorina (strain ATCC 56765 / BCRC 32924 / NRRL 11460 / Rut C-30) TaxID=1344414 RepID=A0A024SMG7_HYPJR|nr:hypothetical protein M419DRAFT_72016 [Trichoderma reesei RUT C-30]